MQSVTQPIGALAAWDWAIVVSYLVLALIVSVIVSRVASRSIDSYFVAAQSLPWWWLGTSMVAVFAALWRRARVITDADGNGDHRSSAGDGTVR